MIILLIIVFAAAEISASSDTLEVYTLEPVVIESSRNKVPAQELPYAIEYLNVRERINNLSLSLEELISDVAGVTIDNRYNPSFGDKIIIRGLGSRSAFGVRGIKIFYDGIPLTFADGQSQLNNIDIASVSHIEIIKGPTSALYGNGAGGVINIFSDNVYTDKLIIQPELTVGMFGLRSIRGRGAGAITPNSSWGISVNKTDYKGWRDHSDARYFSGNGNLRFSGSANNYLLLNFSYYNSPYLLNPGSLTKEDAEANPEMTRPISIAQGAGKKIWQWQNSVSYSMGDEINSFTGTAYFIRRSNLNPIPGRIINLQRYSGGVRTEYNRKMNVLSNQLNLTIGADAEYQDDERVEYQNLGITVTDPDASYYENLRYGNLLINQKEEVLGLGPFLQFNYHLTDRFIVTGGLRYDWFDFMVDENLYGLGSEKRKMSKWSPMGGAAYNFNNNKIFFNYGTGFQTPTTVELSNRPDGEGGFNATLEPEEIINYELGYSGYINLFKVSAGVYLMNISNMLIPYQIGGASEEIYYRNAGSAVNKGFEISIASQLSKGLSFSMSYTYLNFIFEDYLVERVTGGQVIYDQLKGNFIPGVPQNRISGIIAYGGGNIKGEILGEWVGKQYVNDYNGSPLAGVTEDAFINDSYFKTNIRLSGRVETAIPFELFAGINNIFNVRYNDSIFPNALGNRFYEPAPGRNVYGGLRLLFSSN
jgi:iron complex outermembrane recepter protein